MITSNQGLCAFLSSSLKCQVYQILEVFFSSKQILSKKSEIPEPHLYPKILSVFFYIFCYELDMMFENVLIEKDHSASAIVEL